MLVTVMDDISSTKD